MNVSVDYFCVFWIEREHQKEVGVVPVVFVSVEAEEIQSAKRHIGESDSPSLISKSLLSPTAHFENDHQESQEALVLDVVFVEVVDVVEEVVEVFHFSQYSVVFQGQFLQEVHELQLEVFFSLVQFLQVCLEVFARKKGIEIYVQK